MANESYDLSGQDAFCKAKVKAPPKAKQILFNILGYQCNTPE